MNTNYTVHTPCGEPSTSKAPIDNIGAITVPPDFCKRAGLEPDHPIWVIDDSDIAIVLKQDDSGYEDCAKELCPLDESGKLELPEKYLHRLEIDENQDILISLSYDGSEVAIETFHTSLF